MEAGQPGKCHSTEVLALIPARGGSKSIPRKNIRPFAGHPLIAYSIAAGLAAETVHARDRLYRRRGDRRRSPARYGAETPFLRPAEFSQDHTPDLPVFQHALRWLAENEGYRPEIVVQLRPTSPFRRVCAYRPGGLPSARAPGGRRRAHGVRALPEPIQDVAHRPGWLHAAADRRPGIPEPYNMPRQLCPRCTGRPAMWMPPGRTRSWRKIR